MLNVPLIVGWVISDIMAEQLEAVLGLAWYLGTGKRRRGGGRGVSTAVGVRE